MSLSLWWSLISQELRRVFSYRVNFWMQFVTQTLGEVSVAYFLWKAIFETQGAEQIGGLSFDRMVIYYIFVSLAGRVIRGRENFQVSSEIYDGNLTKYLLYPVSYLPMKISEHLGFILLALVQLMIGILLVSTIFSGAIEVLQFPSRLVMGVLATISASFFYYLMIYLVEMVAFWADNVWSLNIMIRFIVAFFGGIIVPLSLMPIWIQELLAFTPFPSIGSVPFRLFIGDAGLPEFVRAQILLIVWSIPLGFICAKIWKAGTTHYTGVGQ